MVMGRPFIPRTTPNGKLFPFPMDKQLQLKMDLIIKQLDKNDAWIIIDGDEGSGKTQTAKYLMYYFKTATDRKFSVDYFYFDTDALVHYAKKNKEQLLNWDEGALGGLNSDWATKSQKNLIKLAMTARKKHHIIIICIPKFDQLREYLRVERSICLIHMDMGLHKDKYGDAMYITRRGKERLSNIWRKSHVRPYASCMKKYGGFSFRVPDIDKPQYICQIIDDNTGVQFSDVEYDRKKDEAIESIGGESDEDKQKAKDKMKAFEERVTKKWKWLAWTVSTKIVGKYLTGVKFAEETGIPNSTITQWRTYGRDLVVENVPVDMDVDEKLDEPKSI